MSRAFRLKTPRSWGASHSALRRARLPLANVTHRRTTTSARRLSLKCARSHPCILMRSGRSFGVGNDQLGARVRLPSVVSIGKLSVGQERYYLEQAPERVDAADGGGGSEDYYLDPAEARGEWRGRAAARLGLSGCVAASALRSLLAAKHPVSGVPLRKRAARASVAAFDLTFSAPKSVSVLFGIADEDVVAEVRAAHEAAVREAFAYLERTAAAVRRGHNGTTVLPADGLVAAAFRHRSSRAGDPQLHTHVVVANLGCGPDGRWSALDGRRLYAQARSASAVYQAVLRGELSRRLGVEWTPVAKGIAEIDGVPKAVMREFSRRRADIEAAMAERGVTGPAAAQVAALDTRRRKRRDVDSVDLRLQWLTRAEALGFTQDDVRRVLGRGARELTRERWEQLVDELAGADGLTRDRSTFARRDVLRAICDRLPVGTCLRPGQLEALVHEFLSSPRVVPLAAADEGGVHHRFRRRDGRLIPLAREEHVSTTQDLLQVEQHLLERVAAGQGAGVGRADAAAGRAAIEARPTLSAEQVVMVERLTEGGESVAVVAGRAGTGKTFALDAAREAWEASGFTVMGAAVARRAACELELGAGIPSTSVHQLLQSIARGRRLPHRGIVVVDEAGMLGTRQLAELVDAVTRARGKLVLVGDHRQLPELQAGGSFRALARGPDAIRLEENRRQSEPWERQAVEHLRNGRAEAALALYDRHGRITVRDTVAEAREQLVADWWSSRHESTSLMIAPTRAATAELNQLARARMREAGMLVGDDVTLRNQSFAVGDVVVIRRNDLRLGVNNGDIACITDLAHDGLQVEFRLERDGRIVRPPAGYLLRRTDSGEPVLQHGYAVTGHIAQGMTVDRAYVLAAPGLSQEWAYTAMTRGRHENRLYAGADLGQREEFAPTHAQDVRADLVRGLSTSHAQPLALDHQRAQGHGRDL